MMTNFESFESIHPSVETISHITFHFNLQQASLFASKKCRSDCVNSLYQLKQHNSRDRHEAVAHSTDTIDVFGVMISITNVVSCLEKKKAGNHSPNNQLPRIRDGGRHRAATAKWYMKIYLRVTIAAAFQVNCLPLGLECLSLTSHQRRVEQTITEVEKE